MSSALATHAVFMSRNRSARWQTSVHVIPFAFVADSGHFSLARFAHAGAQPSPCGAASPRGSIAAGVRQPDSDHTSATNTRTISAPAANAQRCRRFV